MLDPQCRNLYINGRRTTVRLERAVWDALEAIAAKEGLTLPVAISRIELLMRHNNLASAIRVFTICYFHQVSSAEEQAFVAQVLAGAPGKKKLAV